MKVERDKFLTEAMGECWHEFEAHGSDPHEGTLYKCKYCVTETFVKPFPKMFQKDFSTWDGFGKLWSWCSTQDWWSEFQLLHLKGMFGVSTNFIRKDLIHPEKFAEAVYKFLKEKDTQPTKCSECHSFGICTESMDWNCTKPWKDKN